MLKDKAVGKSMDGRKTPDKERVFYLQGKDVAAISGRSRTSVFLDIKKGILPATWGSVIKKDGTPNRAWLIHPKDAEAYCERFKKTPVDKTGANSIFKIPM